MLLQFLFGIKSDAVPGRLNQYQPILIVRHILWPVFELRGVNMGLRHIYCRSKFN
jgi:hypothetical protein